VRRRSVGALLATGLIGAAGCTSGHHSSQAPSAKPTQPPSGAAVPQASTLRWYIGAPVLHQLLAVDPTATTTVLDSPRTFVAVTKVSELPLIPAGWSVVPVQTFYDGDALVRAVTSGGIPPQVKGIVLDDERGNHDLTPVNEQADPIPYEQRAAQAVRSKGLLFLDVGNAPPPGTSGRSAAGPSFSPHAAQFADAVDEQIQLVEADLPVYVQRARLQSAAFRATNPRVIILAGVTAVLRAGPATPDEMVAAVQATRGFVDGYWINCPSCTSAQAAVAAGFLHRMAS
jgi:hypothetical protein